MFSRAIKDILNKNKKFLVFLLPLELFTLLRLILPFVRENNLYLVDMVGHFSLAWYIKEYLFPKSIGWNPFFYLGYPQGQFYPFLFHYLVAIFGFLVGVKLAFKLLLSLVILIIPLSFYYFARKFQFSKLQSSLIMFLMWVLLFFPREFLGGSFFSIFNTGMVTSMVGIPLFFFYLGKLKESLETKKYLGVSILLALIILTHIFTTLVSLLALFLFALMEIRKKQQIIFLLQHLLLSFLLPSFWLIPFLGKFRYAAPTELLAMDTLLLILLILFFLFFFLLFLISPEMRKVKLILFLALALLLVVIFRPYLPFPFHSYRLLIFILLLMPPLVISLFKMKPNGFRIVVSLPLLLIMVLLILSSLFPLFSLLFSPHNKPLNPEGVGDINISLEKVEGRILVISLPGSVPSVHTLYHLIPLYTKNYVLRDLFMESSLHSKFVSLIHSEFASYLSSIFYEEIPNENRAELIPYQLKLFDVTHILASENLNYSNQVRNSKAIEVLEYTPSFTKSSLWGFIQQDELLSEISKLLKSKNTSRIVVLSPQGKKGLRILKQSENLQRIKFKINSPKEAKIFLSQNFLGWRGYVNDREVKIHPYGHYFIFYGKGNIELRYEESLLNVLNITSRKKTRIRYRNQTFYLYKIADPKLIEILNYTPKRVSKDWDKKVWDWFNSKNVSKVMVYSKELLPNYRGSGNESVEIIKKSKRLDYLKFFVNSKSKVPLLIKISFFPNWKAYVNGKETKIYLSSPYLMLIYGKGLVELKYEPLLVDYLGIFLSIIGLGWSFLALLGGNKNN